MCSLSSYRAFQAVGWRGYFSFLILIGVIAALALPARQHYSQRAQLDTFMARIADDERAFTDYAMRQKRPPDSLAEIGLQDTRTIDDMVATISLGDDGVLLYVFQNGPYEDNSLMLESRPLYEDGVLTGVNWHCAAFGIPVDALPDAICTGRAGR